MTPHLTQMDSSPCELEPKPSLYHPSHHGLSMDMRKSPFFHSISTFPLALMMTQRDARQLGHLMSLAHLTLPSTLTLVFSRLGEVALLLSESTPDKLCTQYHTIRPRDPASTLPSPPPHLLATSQPQHLLNLRGSTYSLNIYANVLKNL